jgi:transcriptional regulator with XRE-family HTH domain
MDTFGQTLRQLRQQRGWSLRDLARAAAYDHSYLSQVERGVRPPTAGLAKTCDRALHAGGALLAAYHRHGPSEDDMQRRTLLGALGALAFTAPTSNISLEAIRHGVDHAADADDDEWLAIATDYGYAYYTSSPAQLREHLSADLAVLQTLIGAHRDPERARTLLTVAAHLSVIVAMTAAGNADTHTARRWWRTAHRAAYRSGDVDTRVLVAAWEVVGGCYDHRPAAEVLAASEAAIGLAGSRATAAAAGLWAGRAQMLALTGRHAEAAEAAAQVERITQQLPDLVTQDVESLWGWPEHRLRHTQSYVYTLTGDQKAATTAQDRAVTLYPPSQARLCAQVELHRAAGMIYTGHIPDGLRHAADALDRLPVEQHTRVLYEVARQVLQAVPASQRSLPAVDDLAARLA